MSGDIGFRHLHWNKRFYRYWVWKDISIGIGGWKTDFSKFARELNSNWCTSILPKSMQFSLLPKMYFKALVQKIIRNNFFQVRFVSGLDGSSDAH